MSETCRKRLPEEKSKLLKEKGGNLRYGPMPTFPNQRRFTRLVVIFSAMVVVYFFSKKETDKIFAPSTMSVPQRTMNVPCSKAFLQDISQFKDCLPKLCGRGVYDNAVTSSEVEVFREIADKGFLLSQPLGGAAILDLHSGAVSHGDDFINIYKIGRPFLTQNDVHTYKAVRSKIQSIVAAQFEINPSSLHLTHPTFFSRLTPVPPHNIHDEYWHKHVDKETYPSFHYTALLYLSDFKTDFDGGRFLFMDDKNVSYAVEPIKGRVLLFTSGAENAHRVERVTSGVRNAITIAFTCNAALGIKDPIAP